jgi:hypothetical protein
MPSTLQLLLLLLLHPRQRLLLLLMTTTPAPACLAYGTRPLARRACASCSWKRRLTATRWLLHRHWHWRWTLLACCRLEYYCYYYCYYYYCYYYQHRRLLAEERN